MSIHYVIGSGPAGIACAHALLEQGAKVHLLDAGISLEPERSELVAELRQKPAAEWTAGQVARLKEGTRADTKGIPLKLAYGSDFPYRDSAPHLRVGYDAVAVRPSLAQGGLSNVWGAAMLPYRDEDIVNWPIRAADLSEHYRSVAELTGMSGMHDDLDDILPLHGSQPRPLALSRQAAAFLDRLERNRAVLRRSGLYFGRARVAVRVPGVSDALGCIYCGACMYGCPYGHIYSSTTTLQQLRDNDRFTYTPGIVVTSLHEAGSEVRVDGYYREGGAPFAVAAGRVHLAAGTIASTQIVLRSQRVFDRTVWMKDSQYFFVPLMLGRGVANVASESLHTLSQLFVEVLDPAISPHTVHLQIYSYNDLIGRTVRATMHRFGWPFDFPAGQMEGRLLVAQGYLHSDHSSRIGVTLKGSSPDRLELRSERNREARVLIHRLLRKLTRLAWRTGAVPVRPMLQIPDAGRGFHTGGTLPMRERPAALETDVLGRPSGWTRIHVVDSSVLPSIPATTITWSVMANAHRIGTAAAHLE